MLLTDADQLREALAITLRERDEARAEVAMLKDECASISAEFGLPPTIRPSEGEIRRMLDGWKEARAEVERLKADNSVMGEYWSFAAALRDVAERQREACAGAAYTVMSLHPEPSPRSQLREAVVGAVEATPLVTEVDK